MKCYCLSYGLHQPQEASFAKTAYRKEGISIVPREYWREYWEVYEPAVPIGRERKESAIPLSLPVYSPLILVYSPFSVLYQYMSTGMVRSFLPV
jgi:hypothetical protein